MKISAVLLVSTVTLLLCPASEAQTPLNQSPSRVVGQNSLDAVTRSSAPNVVEGRELFQPWSIAIDASSNPPALYVSDQSNNRILGWRNALTFKNGQKADIVLGQVDFTSTTTGGPGFARTAGLNAPNAIAVDAQGNLYVADLGNNRILRYRQPFNQPAAFQVPDFIIGQTNFTSGSSNPGGVSASTLSFTTGNSSQSSGLAFDTAGNLWVSDSGNNRVLRFNAADLARGDNKPSADLVLGQTTFSTNTLPNADAQAALNKAVLRYPSGLAFDPQGRLYVADSLSRVVVFVPPFGNGMVASRIMGVGDVTVVNGQTTQRTPSASSLLAPESVFMIGNNPAVVDRGNNRILIYDSFDKWPAETPLPAAAGTTLIVTSPSAKYVIGQSDFTSNTGNRGLPEANETTLLQPTAGVTYNNDVFVVDSLNNRVLDFPADAALSTGGATAKRVLGQDTFNGTAPNLIEGKEMWLFNGFGQGGNVGPGAADGAGIVIDNTSNPPHLYVADTFNNRILGFKDARAVKPGDYADVVIGQVDFQRSVVNWPNGKGDKPSDIGLFHPSGVAVDANGDLWVADSGNARVIRFASPFQQSANTGEKANLVLGQASLFTRFTDPTPTTMLYPYGLAFTVAGDLLVSDPGHVRVLYFKKGDGFRNTQPADKVIGQPDFFTIQPTSASPNRFSNPRGIATDTDDRLYVTDAGLGRVAIYDRIGSAGNDPAPALILPNINGPQGVYVSPYTGEIWVTNSRSNAVIRYPAFNKLALNPASDYSVASSAPIAVTQDPFGNLFVAEGTNRVAIYFNAVVAKNGATFNETRPLSPGLIASLFPPAGGTLLFTANGQTGAAAGAPLPFTLADTAVTVGGKPAPLYYVGPNQINFVVPYSTPTSGQTEVQVTHPSTGQIVAAYTFPLAIANPGTFMMSNPRTLIAAVNDDGTVNGPDHPVAWNHVVSIYATGGGPMSGAPPDGQAASGPVNTDVRPQVILGNGLLDDKYILYSGLAPQYPGMWQVNIQIPPNVVLPGPADLVLVVNSIPSNTGPGNGRIVTQIYVKQQ